MTEQEFDLFYGAGAFQFAQEVINSLGPCTRRDSWWSEMGPYELIAQACLKRRLFQPKTGHTEKCGWSDYHMRCLRSDT